MASNTKNFKVSEFDCKCCGDNRIDQRVINMAQVIRDAIGVPIRVNSGYRCDTHNLRVGGVKGSYHTKGKAADLSCTLGAKALFMVIINLKVKGLLPDLAYSIWYGRKDFVHIDCGDKRNNYFEARP